MATQELKETNFFDEFFDVRKAPFGSKEWEAFDGIIDFLFKELEFFLIYLSAANAVSNEIYG